VALPLLSVMMAHQSASELANAANGCLAHTCLRGRDPA